MALVEASKSSLAVGSSAVSAYKHVAPDAHARYIYPNRMASDGFASSTGSAMSVSCQDNSQEVTVCLVALAVLCEGKASLWKPTEALRESAEHGRYDSVSQHSYQAGASKMTPSKAISWREILKTYVYHGIARRTYAEDRTGTTGFAWVADSVLA